MCTSAVQVLLPPVWATQVAACAAQPWCNGSSVGMVWWWWWHWGHGYGSWMLMTGLASVLGRSNHFVGWRLLCLRVRRVSMLLQVLM